MRLASLCFSPRLVLAAALVCLGCTSAAKASVIPITVNNGGFEKTTFNGVSNQIGYHIKNYTYTQQVSGWTNNLYDRNTLGYNFVVSGNSTTSRSGAYGNVYGDAGSLSFWGLENGISNGIGPSPDGGNFLAMDGVYHPSAVSQQLTGLTVGMNTKVYFWYAGAQQFGRDGLNTEGFTVSLSDGKNTESHTTTMLQNDSHGFTGWHYTYLDFTATSTTETLSFLAKGTPNGEPPFSLLDGVSVVQVTPEPSSLALLGTGVLTAAGFVRRRLVRS